MFSMYPLGFGVFISILLLKSLIIDVGKGISQFWLSITGFATESLRVAKDINKHK